MNDLRGLGGVSDEDDDLFQSSSDIEVQLDGLQYQVYKEQASIPLKVRPSDFVLRWRF